MRELNVNEIKEVNGGFVANIVGGVAGAIGGFFGAIISGGQEATGSDLLIGAAAGAAAGVLNPVSGLGGLVGAVGGGAASGGVTNILRK